MFFEQLYETRRMLKLGRAEFCGSSKRFNSTEAGAVNTMASRSAGDDAKDPQHAHE